MYAYCNGNPVMLRDPKGMSSESVSEFWQLFGAALSVAVWVVMLPVTLHDPILKALDILVKAAGTTKELIVMRITG